MPEGPSATGEAVTCSSKKRRARASSSGTSVSKRQRLSKSKKSFIAASAPDARSKTKGNGSEHQILSTNPIQTGDTKEVQPSLAIGQVPEADPDQIEEIWKAVRNTMSSSKPSSKRRCQEGLDTTTSGSVETKYRVTSENFQKYTLTPRGIDIIDSFQVPRTFEYYFGTAKAERLSDYARLEGLQHLKVWVTPDQEQLADMAETLNLMQVENDNEAQLQNYLLEDVSLLKKQPVQSRYYKQLERSGLPWVERQLAFVARAKPDDSLWSLPPKVPKDREGSDWNGDHRADCSYWLSLRLHNKQRQLRGTLFYAKPGRALVYPYFTIEFKTDNRDASTARKTADRQLAAAGAIALFNRFTLYQSAVQKRGTGEVGRSEHATAPERRQPGPRDSVEAPASGSSKESAGQSSDAPAALRHFGLTIQGTCFRFWELKPKPFTNQTNDESFGWKGCTVALVFEDQGDNEESIETIARWINEIHHWGMTTYFSQCVADIETIKEIKLNGEPKELDASGRPATNGNGNPS